MLGCATSHLTDFSSSNSGPLPFGMNEVHPVDDVGRLHRLSDPQRVESLVMLMTIWLLFAMLYVWARVYRQVDEVGRRMYFVKHRRFRLYPPLSVLTPSVKSTDAGVIVARAAYVSHCVSIRMSLT